MIRIAITQAAFDAIAATLPVGSTLKITVAFPMARTLSRFFAAQGESYSDVILRLAEDGA